MFSPFVAPAELTGRRLPNHILTHQYFFYIFSSMGSEIVGLMIPALAPELAEYKPVFRCVTFDNSATTKIKIIRHLFTEDVDNTNIDDLITIISDSIKASFDTLASGADSKHTTIRVSECTFLLNMVRFTRSRTGLVINGIRDSLALNDQQQFMLFLQIDKFQKIIGFEDWSTDKQLFNHMMCYLKPYMTGQMGTFVQTFLLSTAPYTLVKRKEPTLYSWAFVDVCYCQCPLLSMLSRIEIILYFAAA
ncbi:hypothetical protein BC937DRAFT_90386 [Endogone sp. FLAS-F59071]|nr:hypothetical protein BC937DRAFT_90386 [Endogone sp. FLAS-F59071]|eukprot:RUS17129.1 hypothetical protein BC937DRAFT_90386 [Endogone sp. FLAS-F59071]